MVMPQGKAQNYTGKLLEGIVEGEELKHGYLVYIDRWTQYPVDPEEGEEIRYFPVFKKALNFQSIGNAELVEMYEQIQRGLWIVYNVQDLTVLDGEQWEDYNLTEGMFITCIPRNDTGKKEYLVGIELMYGRDSELYRLLSLSTINDSGSFVSVFVRFSKTIPGLDVSADNNGYKCEETDEERITHYDAEKGMYYAEGKLIELYSNRLYYLSDINDQTVRVYWPSKSSYERFAAAYNVPFPSLYGLGYKRRYLDWQWGVDWQNGGHCYTNRPIEESTENNMDITVSLRADIDKNGDTFVSLYGPEDLMRYRSCEFIPTFTGLPVGTRYIDEWDFPLGDGTPAGERDANLSVYPPAEDPRFGNITRYGLVDIEEVDNIGSTEATYSQYEPGGYSLAFVNYLYSLLHGNVGTEAGYTTSGITRISNSGYTITTTYHFYIPYNPTNQHSGLVGSFPVILPEFDFVHAFDGTYTDSFHVAYMAGLLTGNGDYINSNYDKYCGAFLSKPVVY